MKKSISFNERHLMVGLLSLYALSSCTSQRQQLGVNTSDNGSYSCTIQMEEMLPLNRQANEQARSEDDETADDIYRKYRVKPSKGSWLGRFQNLIPLQKNTIKFMGLGAAGIGSVCLAVGYGLRQIFSEGAGAISSLSTRTPNPSTDSPLNVTDISDNPSTANPSNRSNISVITEQLLSSDPDNPFSCPKDYTERPKDFVPGSTTVELLSSTNTDTASDLSNVSTTVRPSPLSDGSTTVELLSSTNTDTASDLSNVSTTVEPHSSPKTDNAFDLSNLSTTVPPSPLINKLSASYLNDLYKGQFDLLNGQFNLLIVKDLIEKKKVDVNVSITPFDAPYSHAWFPFLFYCLQDPNQELWNYLMAQGVNLDLPSSDGLTALMYTAKHKQKTQFLWLLENGANPFIKDPNGSTVEDLLKSDSHVDEVTNNFLKVLKSYQEKWQERFE